MSGILIEKKKAIRVNPKIIHWYFSTKQLFQQK